MACRTGRYHNRERAQQTPFNWQDGDIAFLKSSDEFSQTEWDTLIETGYVKEGATKHPVIILEHSRDSSHFLVATVSAYRSGPDNGYLPPWEQRTHSRKNRNAFRAFTGSKKSSANQKHLELGDGGCFPKPKTSWVYTPFIFVVPSSTLKCFDKTAKRLRMTQESLKDLLGDMAKNNNFAKRWTNPNVLRMLGHIQGPPESRSTSPPESAGGTPAITGPKPGVSKTSWAAIATAGKPVPALAPIPVAKASIPRCNTPSFPSKPRLTVKA
ncbi:hypothetical protein GGR54DRAFT_651595 [Hypoxylon sp. NC1633]|nr:hypothetical protein GGR54DRAFT_651595 [Hypoxylon sp. NC1633]